MIHPTVIEAASWRLASELFRRHTDLRLIRGHPGGGQYDLLWLFQGQGSGGGLDLVLNREGTIQIHGRADGREPEWPATSWEEYLSSDPREFLQRLESACGLAAPSSVPKATQVSLTYRLLAETVAMSAMAVKPMTIHCGYIDTSGYGGGPNPLLEAFPALPGTLTRPIHGDLFDLPGYRFWIVVRKDKPVFVVEQSTATAWRRGSSDPIDVMEHYRAANRRVETVAADLAFR